MAITTSSNVTTNMMSFLSLHTYSVVVDKVPPSQPPDDSHDTVSISGQSVMLSRLFHTDDPNAMPKVKTILSSQDVSGNAYSFLTMNDRKHIATAYEYAVANSIDLVQVDRLAFDLSIYRHLQANGSTAEITGVYDMEGNPWVGRFNDHDSALAKRMLGSSETSQTELDNGFLAYILNPQRRQNHAVDFESLEKFISALSPSGGNPLAEAGEVKSTMPSDPQLAQSLYRIDNPYDGGKWEGIKANDNHDNSLSYLSENEVTRTMANYQILQIKRALSDMNSQGEESIASSSAYLLKNKAQGIGSLDAHAAIEHLGAFLTAVSNSITKNDVRNLLSIKFSHINTSA